MKLLRISWVVGLLCGASGTGTANAQLVSNLYSFGNAPDGNFPYAGLVQGSDGNFYGTTSSGGANNRGTVFRISSTGSYSNLYSFGNSPDGSFPYAGLVQGSDGNFYGTTSSGGVTDNGTVFRISSTGSYSNLYSFVGFPTDGNSPLAGLVQGSDGNFYGTTQNGGATDNGTVFRISSTGSYSNLYTFGISPDGRGPRAGLVQGSDGNFYGTTLYGGATDNGTVFRISSTGSYSNLYSFGGSPDGSLPAAGLVQGSDGNFYGTTDFGGATGNGMVFRISSTGSYSNLYTFGGFPDGSEPRAGLVQGSDGNFYGTTSIGGATGDGTVFRISATGSYSNLYSFAGSPDGQNPYAGLVQGSDGNFYGTTSQGGANDRGTVFKLTGPFHSSLFRITSIVRITNDVAISWLTASGEVNVVQFTAGAGGGSYSNNFTDLSSAIFVKGSSPTTTNYLDVGGATNSPARYYRVKWLTGPVYYSFNATNLVADIGATRTSFTNFNPAAAALTFPGGSLLNVQSGFGAGVAVSQSGWSSNSAPAYLQFGFNGSGYTNIVVSFWEQKSAAGPSSVDFQVSTNGGSSFATFSTLTSSNAPGNAHTVNLSSVTGLNNNPNDVFRLSSGNASNVGGTYRIDNLTIRGDVIAP